MPILILDGHDHNFQRSHQLRCVDVDTTTSSCTDSDFQAEAGAVIVVSGWAGRPGYDVSGSDPEAGYFATFGAPNQTGWTRGYLTMVATDSTLTGTWTTVGGGNTDTFSVQKMIRPPNPAAPSPDDLEIRPLLVSSSGLRCLGAVPARSAVQSGSNQPTASDYSPYGPYVFSARYR